jgi:hypothetical protein
MARVFLSYAREDKPVLKALASGLSDAGHKIWSDEQLGAGDGFRDIIEAELAAAEVVIVLWSKRAKVSRYVLDEAERAVSRGVLLPIRLDNEMPLGYGTLNALDFRSWGGSYECELWRTLIHEVARIARVPSPPPRRIPLQVVRQAAVVIAISGLVAGSALWLLYPTEDGYPILSSLLLGLVGSAPVALVSALEIRISRFDKLSLVARRTLRWLLYGGCFALLIVVLAQVQSMASGSSSAGVREVLRALVTVGLYSSAIAATAKLFWMLVKRR